jgi:tRNA dimethylallyltransferase
VVRALEVVGTTGRPFSSFGPGLGSPGGYHLPVVSAGLWLPRAVGARRIAERVATMFVSGLVDEVRRLSAGALSRTARQAIGYQEVLDLLAARESLEGARGRIEDRTRALARRQRMWFRRDTRITWLGAGGNSLAVLPTLLATWRAAAEEPVCPTSH